MTHQQVLADLARAFPRQPVTADTLRVYLRELDDIPADALEVAVRALIRTSEFFPTVRAIRETVTEATLALPGEAEALGQVAARVAWLSSGLTAETTAPPLHEKVKEALNLVGGASAFRASSDQGVVRGQFARYYRELRATAVREAQTGTLRDLIEATSERPGLPPGSR